VVQSVPEASAREAVVAAGRKAARAGWVPATSGNFSVRCDERRIAITRSGTDKGELTLLDVVLLDLDATSHGGASAETPLHVALYRSSPAIGAVFHVHSPGATVAARLAARDGVILVEGWELAKALPGVRSHETVVELPVLDNDQDVPALAARVDARLAEPASRGVRAPGFALAGHGLYAWGATADLAWRHVEALEVLLAQHLAFRTGAR
jgi:methylthioribulose-1-phosphate dehydratase